MDDRDDRQDETTEDGTLPATGPRSGRVRIVGAETAGEATGQVPAVRADPIEPGDTVQPGGAVKPAGSGTPPSAVQPLGTDWRRDPVEPEEPVETDSEPWSVPWSSQPPPPLFEEPDRSAGDPASDPYAPVESHGTGIEETPSPDVSGLPHWTEPPTGQVPAVLARDPGDGDDWRSRSGPTWREEQSDWTAHEDQFDPDLYANEETALGSLDENDAPDPVRRPWEFDLPLDTGRVPQIRLSGEPVADLRDRGTPSPAGFDYDYEDQDRRDRETPTSAEHGDHGNQPAYTTIDPVTEVVEAVGRGATHDVEPDPYARPGDDDFDRFGPEEEPPVPARSGRLRRGGGRGGRLRARRPEGAVGDPGADALAAEPPGASVTDVPGVGLRRGGIAGLAAADRSAAAPSASTTELPAGPDADMPPGRSAGRVDFYAEPEPPRQVPPRSEQWFDGEPAEDPPARRGLRLRRGRDDSGHPGTGPEPPEQGDRDEANVGVRIATGIAAAVIALVLFALGAVPALILCIVVVTFAAGECFGVLRRAGYHPATLLGLVGTVALMIAAYTKGASAIPLVLVLIVVFTFLWYLFGVERGAPVAGAAATLLTVGWISVLGSFAALLLAPSDFPHRHGIAFLLGAIIATVANDVGGLVIGGWLGRHPLAPSISPNKTWEGWFGGLVLSVVVSAALVGAIHPWTLGKAAVLGLVVAVVAPLGDLAESLLKRDLHIKDMGTLLPGHGGVLDRVDALLFVLPATYYLVRAFNLG
ncbi:MAG TPA: phosphatidate cytidylyltransferase [Acidimicrobiales bacterium]|nr:phosphatidate cytidylyltransferase [Acidimicrobiales bacterium]